MRWLVAGFVTAVAVALSDLPSSLHSACLDSLDMAGGSCVRVTDEWIDNLEFLRARLHGDHHDLATVLISSTSMAQTANGAFPTYECRNPTRAAEYATRSLHGIVDENTVVRDQAWSYRLALYQLQLTLFRSLLDPMLQRQIMKTKHDETPVCFNPIIDLNKTVLFGLNSSHWAAAMAQRATMSSNIEFHLRNGLLPGPELTVPLGSTTLTHMVGLAPFWADFTWVRWQFHKAHIAAHTAQVASGISRHDQLRQQLMDVRMNVHVPSGSVVVEGNDEREELPSTTDGCVAHIQSTLDGFDAAQVGEDPTAFIAAIKHVIIQLRRDATCFQEYLREQVLITPDIAQRAALFDRIVIFKGKKVEIRAHVFTDVKSLIMHNHKQDIVSCMLEGSYMHEVYSLNYSDPSDTCWLRSVQTGPHGGSLGPPTEIQGVVSYVMMHSQSQMQFSKDGEEIQSGIYSLNRTNYHLIKPGKDTEAVSLFFRKIGSETNPDLSLLFETQSEAMAAAEDITVRGQLTKADTKALVDKVSKALKR